MYKKIKIFYVLFFFFFYPLPLLRALWTIVDSTLLGRYPAIFFKAKDGVFFDVGQQNAMPGPATVATGPLAFNGSTPLKMLTPRPPPLCSRYFDKTSVGGMSEIVPR